MMMSRSTLGKLELKKRKKEKEGKGQAEKWRRIKVDEYLWVS